MSLLSGADGNEPIKATLLGKLPHENGDTLAYLIEGHSLKQVLDYLEEGCELDTDIQTNGVIGRGDFIRLKDSPVVGEDGDYCLQNHTQKDLAWFERIAQIPPELTEPMPLIKNIGKQDGLGNGYFVYATDADEATIRRWVETGINLLELRNGQKKEVIVEATEYFRSSTAGDFLVIDYGSTRSKFSILKIGMIPAECLE